MEEKLFLKRFRFSGRDIDSFVIPASELQNRPEAEICLPRDEESKIKTNVINVGQGGPVNTADVLEQLRKMQENVNRFWMVRDINYSIREMLTALGWCGI